MATSSSRSTSREASCTFAACSRRSSTPISIWMIRWSADIRRTRLRSVEPSAWRTTTTTRSTSSDTLKQGVAGQLQMWGLANTATNANGGTFVDLLYGPHKGAHNLSRFDLAEFNALYDKAERLNDGSERAQLYKRMSQLVLAYAPWVLHTYRIENIVVHPWLRGYKYNTFDPHAWMYYDVW